MPIYEYKCADCENHLEAMQKISDAPLAECPRCGGKLEKQWSRTGFQFKGTGWYVTDYAGKGAEKSETKTETKTETAATTTATTTKTSSGNESTASDGGASKSSDSKSSKPVSDKS
jgi:putative FmdB family regulatory protein